MTDADVKDAVRFRDGYKCVFCGMTNDEHKETFGTILHVHRQLPGGPYTVDGCVSACWSCHRSRHIDVYPQIKTKRDDHVGLSEITPGWLNQVRDEAKLFGISLKDYIRYCVSKQMERDRNEREQLRKR